MILKKRPAMHISWFEALQSEFNKEYEKYSIKYKNSIINIEFIEINNNILSIKFIFNLNQKNLESFKINLSFLLKKLFHNFN